MAKSDSDWKLNTAFEKAQRDHKVARLLRVAREEQDIPICLLSERFGMTQGETRGILAKHGIQRSHDHFSGSINSKRKMA